MLPQDYLAVQGSGTGRIITVAHLYRTVVIHRSGSFTKIHKRPKGQWRQMGFLFLKYLLYLTFGPTMNPLRRPTLLPMPQPIILGLDMVKPPSLQGSILSELDSISTAPFRFGSFTLAGSAATP